MMEEKEGKGETRQLLGTYALVALYVYLLFLFQSLLIPAL